MGNLNFRVVKGGFTLPTILIVSIIMLTLLAAFLQLAATSSRGLREVYYNQLAREASESGTAKAKECLEKSGYIAQWTSARPLRPWTDCSGYPVACPGGPVCYVMNSDTIKSDFSVGIPMGSQSQVMTIKGTVYPVKDGVVSTQSELGSYAGGFSTGGALLSESISFGYDVNAWGVFFIVGNSDSSYNSVGYGGRGQLGTGSFNHENVNPEKVLLPAGVTPRPFISDEVKGVYTNFKSNGYNTFVVGTDGNAYATGYNQTGALGLGYLYNESIFKRVYLPFDQVGQVRTIGLSGDRTYIITNDGTVFAAGSCGNFLLGVNYEYSCPQKTFQPISHTVTSSINKPVAIEQDWENNYIRTEAGAVYAFGSNKEGCGMLGVGHSNGVGAPVRVGSWGNIGQPAITQIQTDGSSTYLLDSNGKVYSAGCNKNDNLGSKFTQIALSDDNVPSTSKQCLQASSTSNLIIYNCQTASSANLTNQHFHFTENFEIKSTHNNRCVTMTSSYAAYGAYVGLTDCNGGDNQKWVRGDGKNIHFMSDRYYCLAASGSSSYSSLRLVPCSNSNTTWTTLAQRYFREMYLPPGRVAKKIYTDYGFVQVLTDSNGDSIPDELWTYGQNHRGQAGGNDYRLISKYMASPIKFVLPSGVTPVSMTSTNHPVADHDTPVAYSLVIGSDGKVYGAGVNRYGQLGIGTTDTYIDNPRPMLNISGATNIAAGAGTSVIMSGGKVYTVGNNQHGQLGDGTTTAKSVPEAHKHTNPSSPMIF